MPARRIGTTVIFFPEIFSTVTGPAHPGISYCSRGRSLVAS